MTIKEMKLLTPLGEFSVKITNADQYVSPQELEMIKGYWKEYLEGGSALSTTYREFFVDYKLVIPLEVRKNSILKIVVE